MADRRLRWELLTLGGMYLGYMAFILCRTAVYAASPAMVEDPALGLSKSMFGAVLGWGTAGMVTGKLVSGAVADALGGRRVFLLALAITAASAGAFGLARGYAVFCLLNFTMLLAASAGWPAMSQIIKEWYEPGRYGKVWGVISTSSRLSAVLSTLLLGALLARLPWPRVFLCAAALAALIAVGISLFLKARPADAGLSAPKLPAEAARELHALDSATLGQALLAFARSGRFWLMCVSLMCTTVLMEVIGFLPLYLKDTLALSPAQASAASSVFPAGCLVALVGGGWLYDRVSRRGRAALLGGMLAVSALCLAALLAFGRLALPPSSAYLATMAVLFLYGLTVAPSYYLPMSVFSIEFGGKHCGALIGLIDAFGYAAAMAFQFGGGRILEGPSGWQRLLTLLLALSVLAAAGTVWFAVEDARQR
jgi:OPA family sugar phosphate sensor protein UhpC-like MFS transporter